MEVTMNISMIVSLIVKLVSLGTFGTVALLYLFKGIIPFSKEMIRIKDKVAETEKIRLFMDISPSAAAGELDAYITKYVQRYISYKFIANRVNYINSEQCEEMVRDTTKLISLEIPEIYVFYINITKDIKDGEDLVEAIHQLVKNKAVEEVVNFNKQMEI